MYFSPLTVGFISIQCSSVEPHKKPKSLAVILLLFFVFVVAVCSSFVAASCNQTGWKSDIDIALQYRGPPRSFGEQGKGHLFQGSKGQMLKGTGEQRQYWGTGNIRKQIFDFWGAREQANLFQGNKGTGTPPPWGPQYMYPELLQH